MLHGLRCCQRHCPEETVWLTHMRGRCMHKSSRLNTNLILSSPSCESDTFARCSSVLRRQAPAQAAAPLAGVPPPQAGVQRGVRSRLPGRSAAALHQEIMIERIRADTRGPPGGTRAATSPKGLCKCAWCREERGMRIASIGQGTTGAAAPPTLPASGRLCRRQRPNLRTCINPPFSLLPP